MAPEGDDPQVPQVQGVGRSGGHTAPDSGGGAQSSFTPHQKVRYIAPDLTLLKCAAAPYFPLSQ